MTRARLALLAGTALAISATSSAKAADWTGYYVGANLGYSWGSMDVTTTPFTVLPTTDPFIVPGDTFGLKPNGVIGGVQTGYNWQAGSWVYGVETDFQASAQKDRIQRTRIFLFDCSTSCTATSSTDITAKLSWFGTVRTRIGQDFNGLFGYITGGLAYGEVKISGSDAISVTGDQTAFYARPFDFSKIKAGWTIGAGVEGQFAMGNWTWRVEYLFIDLGNVNYSDPNIALSSSVTDNIVRFALNYRVPPPR